MRQSKSSRRLSCISSRIEELESRDTPAPLYWDPPDIAIFPSNNWSDGNNWWDITSIGGFTLFTPAYRTPGVDDDVFFRGGACNDDCILDVPKTVRSINMNQTLGDIPGYTGTLTLKEPLTVSGNASLLMSGATIRGFGGARGSLTVNPSPGLGTSFRWAAGTFENVAIDIKPSANFEVVDGVPGSSRNMNDTAINLVSGGASLNWAGGNVAVGGTSSIQVGTDGTFGIYAAGFTWGTATPSLQITNFGTTRLLASGTATLIGDYITHDKTLLSLGILDIVGRAEQGEFASHVPVFELQNRTTIRVSGTGEVLGIRAGSLIGDGTVDANLNLGNDPAAGGAASEAKIAPGNAATFGTMFGTIDVTKSMEMFGDRTVMEIDVDSITVHDRVSVAFRATLNGTIAGNFLQPARTFLDNAKIVFLTYGERAADFVHKGQPAPWRTNMDATKYWFEKELGNLLGKAALDENGNGAFEPWLGEVPLAGVAVRLFDSDGYEVADPTTTDGDGVYDFGRQPYGAYEVRFTRPAALRPVLPHSPLAGPTNDSDADFGTLIAAVSLGDPSGNTDGDGDVLFRPLVAVDDYYYTPYLTPVSGNVLANDPPAAGDTLTITLGAAPAHGAVDLAADGTFTYAPAAGFYGNDTFTYVVHDGFGHTATGLVNVYVSAPPTTTISGYIWRDLNGNGVNDIWSEYGVYNVTVQLLDADGNVVASVLTGAGSIYYVFNVLPGTYQLRVLLPEGFAFTTPGGDSDVDEYGYSAFFTTAGGEYLFFDAGMIPPT